MTSRLLLAIDQGNTNTVFAIFRDDNLLGQWRIATKTDRTADEFAVWLHQLLELDGIDGGKIEDAIIASVTPQALFDLKTLCRKHFGCDPVVVGENAELGIPLRIDDPREAGADRVVNAVGAFVTFGGPLVVIDFGTATTFDVIDQDGGFAGGVFAPGINLALDAMHRISARLPRIGVEKPGKVIGTNTVACMQSGVYWGYVSLIEGVVQRVRAEYGKPMRVVATGGLAPMFDAATDAIDEIDPDVTVRGLLEVWRRSRARDA
ncbi:MAG: type III pantothenate kinase [Rhodospirillales bacterium]|nr:type III pantothenate kinase [Rhodospirillales bacterium]